VSSPPELVFDALCVFPTAGESATDSPSPPPRNPLLSSPSPCTEAVTSPPTLYPRAAISLMSTTLFRNSTFFCVLLLHVVPLLSLSTPSCCCHAACRRHPATHCAVAALQHPVRARPHRPAHCVQHCHRSLFRIASSRCCPAPSDAELTDAVYKFHVKASYSLATEAATPFCHEHEINKVKIVCCSLKSRHTLL
jgi:hypothetical protein